MSLLFDTHEVENFRAKVPTEDFAWLPDLIGRSSNLAGSMVESQDANEIHIVFLRKLELFATEVPQGLDGLRAFATKLIHDYQGVDGDNELRLKAISLAFAEVEGKPEPEPAQMFPHLPDPPSVRV